MLKTSWLIRLVLTFPFAWSLSAAESTPLPLVHEVELQPVGAQVKRLIETLDSLGAPLAPRDVTALEKAIQSTDNDAAVEAIQKTLDKYCLAGVNINPESRVKVARGPAKAELLEQGWRTFLVKVHNEAGVTAELLAVSPNAKASYEGGWGGNSD